MIIRQLQESQYQALQQALTAKACLEPFSASYTVTMTIDRREYALRIQPERHHKMAILQALRIDRGPTGPTYELITKGNLLSSLLEILIDQGAA